MVKLSKKQPKMHLLAALGALLAAIWMLLAALGLLLAAL